MDAPFDSARRRWMLSGAGLLTLTALGACTRTAQPGLRIGTNVWIGCEPLYLARELGKLDPASVQLVEYPSASEVLRAYRNQAIDGMVISLDELLGLASDGFDPRVVLVIDISHGADAVIGRAGMRSMRDLAGKSVAVERGALGVYMLSRALTLSGMQPGDVRVVHLESNEQPAAFRKGSVDAAVSFDPYRTQLLQAGGQTLFDSTRIPGEIVDLVAVRKSVLNERASEVTALLAGWFGAIDFMRNDPKEAARRMAIRLQTDAEQFLQAQQGLRIPTRAENLNMLGGSAPALVQSGSRLMQLMLEARLLHTHVNVENLLAPEPLLTLSP